VKNETNTIARLTGVADRVYGACGWVSIVALWFMLLICLADVAVRPILGTTIPGKLELARWSLACLTYMGLAWTLRVGGHIQVNLLFSRFSSRTQHWLTVFLSCVGMACAAFFAFYAWQGMADLFTTGTVSDELRLQRWWARVPFFLGFVTLATGFAALALEKAISPRLTHEREEGLSPVWVIGLLAILIGMVSFLLVWPQALGMTPLLILPVMVFLIFGLIGSGMWVFLALCLAGLLGLFMFTSYPVGTIAGKVMFNSAAGWTLTCLPLFIFMGELLFRSGASRHLYSGLGSWVERIPGRLLHSNILSCSIFAAISGSGAATTATVGIVAIPELKRLGYDKGISLGSLAGAGTLGLLIPPSIAMIVYGAITTESIGQLFMGGILPGIMLSFLFMSYIGVTAIRRPSIAPPSRAYSWDERIKGALEIIPMFITIGLVLGLIYTGITTPTEAGAVGAFCALGTLALYRTMSWEVVKEASWSAIRTTCMVIMIFVGASLLSTSLGYLRVAQHVLLLVEGSGLSKYVLLGMICIMYIGLGCIFEGISMMVLTLPIVYPIILALGFNGIWFGIVLVILIETSQVTPPVGFSLYIIQGVTGETIGYVARNAFPFFLLMLVAVIILVLFPQIALILPNMMISGG